MDLVKYKNKKFAKIALNDLEQVRLILDISIGGLQKYRKYKTVNWLLNDLRANLDILDNHIKKCKEIIDEK
jgi:hypothetical protein